MKTMPDFDQTVLDMVILHGLTLERLAVIGVIPPSVIDRYEIMINPQDIIFIQDTPDDDLTDVVAATMLIYKDGEKWEPYV